MTSECSAWLLLLCCKGLSQFWPWIYFAVGGIKSWKTGEKSRSANCLRMFIRRVSKLVMDSLKLMAHYRGLQWLAWAVANSIVSCKWNPTSDLPVPMRNGEQRYARGSSKCLAKKHMFLNLTDLRLGLTARRSVLSFRPPPLLSWYAFRICVVGPRFSSPSSNPSPNLCNPRVRFYSPRAPSSSQIRSSGLQKTMLWRFHERSTLLWRYYQFSFSATAFVAETWTPLLHAQIHQPSHWFWLSRRASIRCCYGDLFRGGQAAKVLARKQKSNVAAFTTYRTSFATHSVVQNRQTPFTRQDYFNVPSNLRIRPPIRTSFLWFRLGEISGGL